LKQRSTRYIHYSEPNQEPPEHIKGKERIKHILLGFDYVLVQNTNDEHQEFQLPELVTNFIAKTEKERIRQFQIDLLMHNQALQKIIAIEVHGAYHFKNKESIAKMRLKEETILDYLGTHSSVRVDDKVYSYKTYKMVSFRTEEVYGRIAFDRLQLIDKILNK
jgi:hypothetical protein